jgi:hypothetical protein
LIKGGDDLLTALREVCEVTYLIGERPFAAESFDLETSHGEYRTSSRGSGGGTDELIPSAVIT